MARADRGRSSGSRRCSGAAWSCCPGCRRRSTGTPSPDRTRACSTGRRPTSPRLIGGRDRRGRLDDRAGRGVYQRQAAGGGGVALRGRVARDHEPARDDRARVSIRAGLRGRAREGRRKDGGLCHTTAPVEWSSAIAYGAVNSLTRNTIELPSTAPAPTIAPPDPGSGAVTWWRHTTCPVVVRRYGRSTRSASSDDPPMRRKPACRGRPASVYPVGSPRPVGSCRPTPGGAVGVEQVDEDPGLDPVERTEILLDRAHRFGALRSCSREARSATAEYAACSRKVSVFSRSMSGRGRSSISWNSGLSWRVERRLAPDHRPAVAGRTAGRPALSRWYGSTGRSEVERDPLDVGAHQHCRVRPDGVADTELVEHVRVSGRQVGDRVVSEDQPLYIGLWITPPTSSWSARAGRGRPSGSPVRAARRRRRNRPSPRAGRLHAERHHDKAEGGVRHAHSLRRRSDAGRGLRAGLSGPLDGVDHVSHVHEVLAHRPLGGARVTAIDRLEQVAVLVGDHAARRPRAR